MNITLYKFSKRSNSTKRPSGGTTVSGRINNRSGITSPSISFSGDYHSYNYAYISSFGRYYWIEEWTYSDGVWIASMAVDVLASYRSDIGNSSQYVTRSSAAYDREIVDTLYPAKAAVTNGVRIEYVWNDYISPIPPQYFVIGIIGGVTNESTGIVTYYQMSASQFTDFSDMVFGSTDYMGSDFGSDVTLDFLKTQINPFQYIVSVKKFPFKVELAAATNTVKIGWWNVSFNCEIINNNLSFHNDVIEIEIPKHPQISRGNFLKMSPYSKYLLYIPYFGTKEIPSEKIANADKITITISTDVTSNRSILFLSTNDVGVLYSFMQYNGEIGQSVIIGQSTTNTLGAGMGFLSAAANIVSGNFIGAASSISDAVGNLSPTLNTQGENTGFSEATQPAKLIYSFIEICDDDNANNGRPLMQVRTISSIPGYIKCENSDIAIQGTDTECTKIKSYMDGGFFYE